MAVERVRRNTAAISRAAARRAAFLRIDMKLGRAIETTRPMMATTTSNSDTEKPGRLEGRFMIAPCDVQKIRGGRSRSERPGGREALLGLGGGFCARLACAWFARSLLLGREGRLSVHGQVGTEQLEALLSDALDLHQVGGLLEVA